MTSAAHHEFTRVMTIDTKLHARRFSMDLVTLDALLLAQVTFVWVVV